MPVLPLRWPHQARRDLLVVDGAGKQVLHITAEDSTTIARRDDLTGIFTSLKTQFPAPRADVADNAGESAWKAMTVYLGLQLAEQMPQPPDRLGTGYVIRYGVASPAGPKTAFVWSRDSGAYSLRLLPDVLARGVTEDLCRRIGRLTPRRTGGYLVPVDDEESGRLALLTPGRLLDKQGSRFELTLYEDTPSTSMTERWVLAGSLARGGRRSATRPRAVSPAGAVRPLGAGNEAVPSRKVLFGCSAAEG